MIYTAGQSAELHPDIFSPVWEQAPVGEITDCGWAGFAPTPRTTFQMLRDAEGLSLRMHTAETPLQALCHTHNGDVYRDSCMEFFIQPDPVDGRYLNFECNPDGILHLGLGADRHNRQLIGEDRATFRIQSDAKPGDWTLKLYIPDSFLLRYFSTVSPHARGNVYKCGDDTAHPHYGSWAEVKTETPDFHRPEFFGELEL